MAAKTIASMKVKRVIRMSIGSKIMPLLRLETKTAARPYKWTIQDRTATNMVKFTAAEADDDALMLLAMTLPISAVMSSVHRSEDPRRAETIKPDILCCGGPELSDVVMLMK